MLAPGGHILIVDMLASPLRPSEWPPLLADKLKSCWRLRNRKSCKKALRQLVTHPDWRRMAERHPLRDQEDFTRYLTSRFPRGEMKVLNTGARAKILAFDSGPAG